MKNKVVGGVKKPFGYSQAFLAPTVTKSQDPNRSDSSIFEAMLLQIESLNALKNLYVHNPFSTSEVPPMTSEEAADQRNYGYKSHDVLTFLNERGKYGSYAIQINDGKKEKIPSSHLLLLIFFAKKLRSDKKGWVSKEEAIAAKIIDPNNPNYLDDILYKLRNKLNPYVRTCGRDEILESSEMRFRLSILPNRIIVPHERWLGEAFSEIKKSLLKKRQKKSRQWPDEAHSA